MPRDSASQTRLEVTLGQFASAGRKERMQDFHGAALPEGIERRLKGIVLAVADGISPSPVSHVAAESAVKALMGDYFATSPAETVRSAASKVIAATNSWLYAQTRHAGIDDPDRAHICTLSALILKARRAHLFHMGDTRIWRLSGAALEPLTEDHTAPGGGWLTRAMGLAPQIEIDYRHVDLRVGDVFMLTSDGVHGYWDMRAVARRIAEASDLNQAAREIAEASLTAGSPDNLTIQIVRIEGLPDPEPADLMPEAAHLPVIDPPAPGEEIDGYRILRALHGNDRSHAFLAEDGQGRQVVLKFPASEMRERPDHLRAMMAEEWIARRFASPHLMTAPPARERTAFYVASDYISGQSLRQWMRDNPRPDAESVREIVEQIAQGLRLMHRREILHQDLRPENILIGRDGVVRIIDFGSAWVAGVAEAGPAREEDILGTQQYSAPEYFSGEAISWRAEMFSLGVITYEMLTGRLPFGAQIARISSPRDRMRLRYRPLTDLRPDLPDWIDAALERATHPDPARRPDALGEFIADLRRPAADYVARNRRPLIDRDPLAFWKGLSTVLGLAVVILLANLLA
ncbi:MAG: bifunctional protein-serine/threonine kinase/phosphatase [Thioclava sp.]|nr:bifunctional protein-serine/threonine kinase/phosphatase [Thioclava sp.]MBD3803223.1 bifunctional protein-serine/threonine kinase/phosphatase [Thioclava sp.]